MDGFGQKLNVIVIGKRIVNRRNELNMTRSKLSTYTGLSERYLGDIERGKKVMSINSLFKISKALYVSADWILCGK